MTSSAALQEAFASHRRLLWGLAYRMTGSAQDAEDIVQETFVRLLEHPPERLENLRPLLVRVAMNLARDRLRQRRREGYMGTWLPSPIAEESIDDAPGPDARYGLVESSTFAFLLALEALTPSQRAVLLLRDVFEYSSAETAGALELSEANVRTTHHRARAALAQSQGRPLRPSKAYVERARAALEALLLAVVSGDVEAAKKLLADDVLMLSDGGGVFAAVNVLTGPQRVAAAYVGIAAKSPPATAFAFHLLNGMPALVAERPSTGPAFAPKFTMSCDVDENGLITRIYTVLAPAKLTAVPALEP